MENPIEISGGKVVGALTLFICLISLLAININPTGNEKLAISLVLLITLGIPALIYILSCMKSVIHGGIKYFIYSEKTQMELEIEAYKDIAVRFLSKFPSWALEHANKLTWELQHNPKNKDEKFWADLINGDKKIKESFVNCLAATNAMFLLFNYPVNFLLVIGGEQVLFESMKKLPEESLTFLTIALTMINKDMKKGMKYQNSMHKGIERMEEVFGKGKKFDGFVIAVATNITQFIDTKTEEELGPFVIVGLNGIIEKAILEYIDWIRYEIIENKTKI